jgi:hypothetical protein
MQPELCEESVVSPAIDASEVAAIAGSVAGRVAMAMNDGTVYLGDIADDCAWVDAGSFQATDVGVLRMSGDGSLLLAGGGNPADPITYFHSLPDGALLDEESSVAGNFMIAEYDVADDGTVWSRRISDGPQANVGEVAELPLTGDTLWSGSGNIVPKIAPTGESFATSDGTVFNTTWADSTTSFHDLDGTLGATDGIVVGFVDDDHALVSRYSSCGGICVAFETAAVVAMDGTVVLETTLPEPRSVARITDGVVLLRDPSGDSSIWDVDAGMELWTAPTGAGAAIAGANHVVVSTGVSIDVVQWR